VDLRESSNEKLQVLNYRAHFLLQWSERCARMDSFGSACRARSAAWQGIVEAMAAVEAVALQTAHRVVPDGQSGATVTAAAYLATKPSRQCRHGKLPLLRYVRARGKSGKSRGYQAGKFAFGMCGMRLIARMF